MKSIDRGLPDEIELLAKLREAGHVADFAPKSMHDLGMRVEKVARFVEKHPADVWVISSGCRAVARRTALVSEFISVSQAKHQRADCYRWDCDNKPDWQVFPKTWRKPWAIG